MRFATGCGTFGQHAERVAGDYLPPLPSRGLEPALPWSSGAPSLADGGDVGALYGDGGTGAALASYTSGDAAVADSAEYNIRIDFAGPSWTEPLQAAFVQAADVIATAIVGDVRDALVGSGGSTRRVDDIQIIAELADMDGPGNMLGEAGPTALRVSSFLPAEARMTFDTADAGASLDAGQWSSVVLHEMLHSIGLGTIWALDGLIWQPESGGAYYTGANASAWLSVLHPELAAATGGLVPLETDGGTGTALAHWDEDAFGSELMTGYLNDDAENALSEMSIGALADLGYRVADQYAIA
jgi:hypothetical protein